MFWFIQAVRLQNMREKLNGEKNKSPHEILWTEEARSPSGFHVAIFPLGLFTFALDGLS